MPPLAHAQGHRVGNTDCSITYLISYNWQKSGGHLTGVWALSCFALLPGGGGSGQGPDPNPVSHPICEGLPAAAVVEGWERAGSREVCSPCSPANFVSFLLPHCRVSKGFGTNQRKDMTMKDRCFFLNWECTDWAAWLGSLSGKWQGNSLGRGFWRRGLRIWVMTLNNMMGSL